MNGRFDGDVLNDGMGIECWVKISGFRLIERFVIGAGVDELAWLCCWVMGGVWSMSGEGIDGAVWVVRVLCG